MREIHHRPGRTIGVATAAIAALLLACGQHGATTGSQEGNAGTFFLVTAVRPVNGLISSSDGRIRCGPAGGSANDCGPARYAWTETATLLATPDEGYVFGTWAGDCGLEGPCVLGAGADRTVAAFFGPPGRAPHGNFTDSAIHGPEYLSSAAKKPGWRDCAYCHGPALTGQGIAPSCADCHERAGHPDWQQDCTFCHGAPPLNGTHPVVSGSLSGCAPCHQGTVDAQGAIIPGGQHMDGVIQASGGHSDGFASPAVHGPAFFDFISGSGGLDCTSCHGQDYAAIFGTKESCNGCHAAAGWPSWRTNCSFCHGQRDESTKGGYDLAAHPSWAAPPDAVETRLTGASALDRAGAHPRHLTASPFAPGFKCETCHAVPTGLSHVGPRGTRATVVLAGAGQASLPAALGSYDPGTGTCATYCHGSQRSPAWGSTGMTCGACHGLPPAAPHPAVAGGARACGGCHPATVGSDGAILVSAGTHVNGVVDFGGGSAGCGACHGYPPATGAHRAHSGSQPSAGYGDARIVTGAAGLSIGCGACHPTDATKHVDGLQQILLDPALVLPGGTTTAGALVSGAGAATSCTVACHQPFGAPARAVSWSAAGPLACTSCHSKINPGGATPSQRTGPSLHDPMFGDARPASGEKTTCWSCHKDTLHDASHLSGDAALVASADLDATCIACHSPPAGPGAGAGQVLQLGGDPATSRTPPVLTGWTDAVNGDFHGARASTGYGGGTLRAPYVRGQGPLPCTSCHAGHASANPFLLAARVNGVPIPAKAIDRSGVGAEALCSACHAESTTQRRHGYCIDCHGGDPAPAGSPCFTCHGHEGLVSFTVPGPYHIDDPDTETFGCAHCHDGAYGPLRMGQACWSTLPALSPAGSAPAITAAATNATASFSTAAVTTAYLEFGTAGRNPYVVGGATATSHSVSLSGLSPSTTYSFRVRLSDVCRNSVESSAGTFTTAAASFVQTPTGLGNTYVGNQLFWDNTFVQGFWWSAVPDAVQYEVQIAGDSGFTSLSVSPWFTMGSGSRSAPNTLTLATSGGGSCAYKPYYWRVRARSPLGYWSGWSATVYFGAGDCS